MVDVLDMTRYFPGDGPIVVVRYLDDHRQADEAFQGVREGNFAFLLKGHPNSADFAYESFFIPEDRPFIYRYEDMTRSDDTGYVGEDPRDPLPGHAWFPRFARVGQEHFIDVKATVYRKSGDKLSEDGYNSRQVLVAHHDTYTTEGGITVEDVIEIHGYPFGSQQVDEIWFFAAGIGMVAWKSMWNSAMDGGHRRSYAFKIDDSGRNLTRRRFRWMEDMKAGAFSGVKLTPYPRGMQANPPDMSSSATQPTSEDEPEEETTIMTESLLKNTTLQWDEKRRPVIVNVDPQKHHVIEHATDWNIMSYAAQPAVEGGQSPLEVADVLHIHGGGFKLSGGHIGWRVEMEQIVQPQPGQYQLVAQFTPDISMMENANFADCVEWRWVVSSDDEKIEGGWHTVRSGNHKTLQRFEQVVAFGVVDRATIGLQFRAKWGNQAGELRVHSVEAQPVTDMETDWLIPSAPETTERDLSTEAEIAMRREPLEERLAENAADVAESNQPQLTIMLAGTDDDFRARAEAMQRFASLVELYDSTFAVELREMAVQYLKAAARLEA
jgi:hypothetical protein